ncbi:UDP-glucuronosyl/UDP-glucosyltransferase [Parasponia andersonii]|uniref:Glycosyltransferase n=1 Tax=Parasponia andersonii TaxID=3476 RepID=A0A2P5DT05_PARAD|nr:UDP-glucuronosyl/UDP-glucosyltransferase [Parasponia andersonii]
MAPRPSTVPQVVIFPFMAQGHTLPLLDLSKALSSKQINVTIITTPSNAKSILDHVSKHPNIRLIELPFPTSDSVPRGCENTSQLPSMEYHAPFLMATKRLRNPFEQVLNDMKESQCLPLCVVSDFFLGFTQPVCQSFGIPRLVFHGMGVLPMAICKASWVHKPNPDPDSGHIDLSGLKLPFILTASDLPHEVVNSSDLNDPMSQFLEEVGEADVNSWGVIVNSFVDLELGRVSYFESFYKNGARAWCIGPLNLYDEDVNTQNAPFGSTNVMKWLKEHESRSGSVLYVSFGSQADVSDAQLDEVGLGLVESGVRFIWVVRSKTWSPPNDMKERLDDRRGLILSDWVDQRRILSHVSIGGFLSHCGWNSVLESLSVGVPILAWPMMAEQALNARVVVDGLGAGVRVSKQGVAGGSGNGVVSWKAISKGVRELMGEGEKGTSARERARVLGGVARRAVEEGGSSYKTLDELLQKLQCQH